MFLFNSRNSGWSNRNFNQVEPRAQKKRSLFAALTGEERPQVVGGLLFALVVLLHLWGALWLLKPPAEQPKSPAMMVMEVSLVSAPQPPAPVTPPAPQPPKPPEPPKKQPEKKVVKKKAPVVPKQVEVPKQQTVVEEKPSLPAPPVVAPPALAAPVVSRPVQAPVSPEPKISSGIVPLERVPPKYPARAAERHIEGWVKVEFTIATDGTVKDAAVVEAEPADVFDEAALRAINQWIFKEKIVNGVPVEQRAVQTLQFKLTR
ncbi:MAG: energy transducer TonB [Methylobacter sp.]